MTKMNKLDVCIEHDFEIEKTVIPELICFFKKTGLKND